MENFQAKWNFLIDSDCLVFLVRNGVPNGNSCDSFMLLAFTAVPNMCLNPAVLYGKWNTFYPDVNFQPEFPEMVNNRVFGFAR